ncbi:MAG: molybdopterin-dependent oxidoreductase [Roseovarius sp.]|nr:molybdopterin-dependent oxidoreductase [Roseovarius sp.]
MPQISLMIDLDACIGCKSCEAACKQEHGLGPHTFRNQVLWLENGTQTDLAFLTVTCQHCDRPACLRACPVNPKVIAKDPETGVVSVDQSRCTGCGECVKSCPYGAMGFDAGNHHAVKCDLCADRRSAGKDPACASACPADAIHFGDRDDLLARVEHEGRARIDNDKFLMKPATIYLEPRPRQGSNKTPLPSDPKPPAAMGADREASLQLKANAPYGMPREERQPDRIVPGGCNICFNGCPIKFHLKEDKVVAISGNDEDPIFRGKVCPKSQMTLQLYNSDLRLTEPLKRVGPRGSDRFETVTWERALDEIAGKLLDVKERHGPESLAIFMGTRAGMITKYGYVKRFAGLWGTPNVEGTETLCSTGKSTTLNMTQGTQRLTNIFTEDDIGSADLFVYVGDNQAETRPVNFGMVNRWRKQTGARMITVDPRLSATAAKSDEWLPIRSGTDMALGLALIHTIFAENLQDQRFCDEWILGWRDWRDFVFDQGYSADWAAPIADIPAERIAALARQIASADGCMIFCSRGLNQHTNSVQTNRVMIFVAAVTGNYGRKGGGYYNMASEMAMGSPLPRELRAPTTRGPVGRNPMSWLQAMTSGEPYRLHAMIAGCNPFSSWADQEAVRNAVGALDLLVHIDLFKNETSRHADYVLPAATGIERGGISRSASDRRIVWNDAFIPPPGNAKSDGWIWVELGRRLGMAKAMPEKYKNLQVFWDEVCNQSDDLRGVTVERLRKKPNRWLRTPLPAKGAKEPGTFLLDDPSDDFFGRRFLIQTASGKLEFFTPELDERFKSVGLSALPEFYSEREQLVDLPHIERIAGEMVSSPVFPRCPANRHVIVSPSEGSYSAKLRDAGFDTELISGRPNAAHFHSWTHYFWQAQEMWPDLFAQIHPEKAAKTGISDGDRIVIETVESRIEAIAWVRAGIREQAIFVPIGWGESQPYHPWKSVNFLTSHMQRDPLAEQINLKTKLCRVLAKTGSRTSRSNV